jgi:hypothetical protein
MCYHELMMRAHGDAMADTDARSQADKFRDLARELEADESQERFEESVRKIAKAPENPPKDDE